MSVLSKNWRYFFLWCAATAAFSVNSSGTVIIAAFTPDGVVIASDGLVVYEEYVPKPTPHFKRSTAESEPKIVVCNIRFLCANSGTGLDTSEIEYDFPKSLPPANAKTGTTVRNYAQLIQDKARITFKEMESILRQSDLSDPETSKSDSFQSYLVVGYDGDVLNRCRVEIKIDRVQSKLIYPDIICDTPTEATKYSQISGNSELSRKIVTRGTSENKRYGELVSKAGATTRTLFPDAPPTIQNAIAEVSIIVAMQGQLDPQYIGGTTRIGVLLRGACKLPIIHSPVDLALGKSR
jgi:hypothetical protein